MPGAGGHGRHSWSIDHVILSWRGTCMWKYSSQLAGIYSILCQFCENIRDSQLYAWPAPVQKEEKYIHLRPVQYPIHTGATGKSCTVVHVVVASDSWSRWPILSPILMTLSTTVTILQLYMILRLSWSRLGGLNLPAKQIKHTSQTRR